MPAMYCGGISKITSVVGPLVRSAPTAVMFDDRSFCITAEPSLPAEPVTNTFIDFLNEKPLFTRVKKGLYSQKYEFRNISQVIYNY